MEDFNATDELANLKEKLQATRDKFSDWNDDIATEMKDWFSQFDANIQKHDQHLNELKNSLNTLKQQNEATKQAAESGLTSLEATQQGLKALQKCVLLSQTDKEEAEKAFKNDEEELASEKDDLQSLEHDLKQKTDEFSKSAVLTKDILGLSFQKAPGQKMQVVFRQINPNDVNEPFVLSVEIVSGKYVISDCDPKIEDIQELTEKLNESNNFRAFLITARSRFQAKV